jgi:hypothetical protein
VQHSVVAAEHDGQVDPALREESGVVVVEDEAWMSAYCMECHIQGGDTSGEPDALQLNPLGCYSCNERGRSSPRSTTTQGLTMGSRPVDGVHDLLEVIQ